MRFYLGTHRPRWIGLVDAPLFVSVRTLRERPIYGPALAPWALDSGGFTELLRGEPGRAGWVTPLAQYVEEVERVATDAGQLVWAAPQDWMCEPEMIHGGRMPGGLIAPGTGLSVREHQERTVQSVLDLRAAAPHLPFAPVLQGFTLDESVRCVALYVEAGIDLHTEPVVGLGSVCRRQGTDAVGAIVRELASGGLRLHGFGVKTSGIPVYGEWLASADSLAWSKDARHAPPLPECVAERAEWEASGCPRRPQGSPHRGRCANCPRYALRWRDAILGRGRQLAFA